MTTPPLFDPQEVAKTLHLMVPNQVFELRALNATLKGDRYPATVFGFFNDIDQAITELGRLHTATGIYLTPNPVNPALLARAHNRLKRAEKQDALTRDADIRERRWWLIDIDPVRPSQTSASDAQKQEALRVGHAVFDYLTRICGWPAPLCADSGNGCHLMVPLAEGQLDTAPYQAALDDLAQRFNTDTVTIDPTVTNLARIWKLYGTTAGKGDPVPELGIRHRQSHLLNDATPVTPIDHATFTTLLGSSTGRAQSRATLTPAAIAPTTGTTWLDQWLAQYFPEAGEGEPWSQVPGGRIWKIDCPWNPAHVGKACITQRPNGSIGASCRAASCRQHHWRELRDLKEPGWQHKPRATTEPWPTPRPFPMHAVAPLDPDLLPDALRPFVLDVAERLQVPGDFVAVSVLTVIGSLLGRHLAVFPKRHDDWYEFPNLWALLVGPPGMKKTPAMQAGLQPLHALEQQAREVFAPEWQQYQADLNVHQTRHKALEKALEKIVLQGAVQQIDQAEQALNQHAQSAPEKPRLRRFMVNDTTVEKLLEVLGENPNGLLLVRDELMAFLKSLEKTGRETDRAFYLEAWSAKSGFSVDRIGRGSQHIAKVMVSLLGGIQPGRLKEYLQASLTGGSGDDGLVQRFQLMVAPVASAYVHHDRPPDHQAEQQLLGILDRLAQFQPLQLPAGLCPYRQKGAVHGLGFSEDAQALFDAWYIALETRLRTDRDLLPAMQAHLAKYGSLMAKLALLFEVIDTLAHGHPPPTAIQSRSTLRAMAWCEYLESHAAHLYGAVKNGARVDAAIKLLDKLRAGDLQDGFSAWEVTRKGWTGLKDAKEVQQVLGLLETQGWIRVQRHTDTQGRPAERVYLHPDLQDRCLDVPEHLDYATTQLERLKATLTPSESPWTPAFCADLCADLPELAYL